MAASVQGVAMHVLFVLDPLPLLKAYKDSSVAMMRALVARGHTLSVAMQGDLYIEGGTVKAVATPIELVADADLHGHDWWRESAAQDLPLAEFGAVVMRKDPPFDMEYVYSTHLLEYAEAQGARVFNGGAAIRNHPEKLAITEISEFTAPTLVTRNMARLKAFHDVHHDVIVKPLDGMGGTGVFRLQPKDPNLNAILETLTDNGARTIMAQRYIPDIVKGDKRILLIGDYVTEVNVTSPTCFVEIAEQTGFDVAGMFVTALEKAVAAKASA
jgi:glutathione synthase